LILEKTGRQLVRRDAKDINLGTSYGMGIKKLARKLGIGLEAAKEIMQIYHAGVPYVRRLETRCMEVAQERGYIWTILRRKRRFPLWESAKQGEYSFPIRDRAEALQRWGSIRRAYTHKALNARCQGSAADQMKKAIVDLSREGLLPQLQVYDEVDGSYASVKEARRVQEIMEHAVETTVPFIAEPDVGTSWGDVKVVEKDP
jgi:DNA polymerase I